MADLDVKRLLIGHARRETSAIGAALQMVAIGAVVAFLMLVIVTCAARRGEELRADPGDANTEPCRR